MSLRPTQKKLEVDILYETSLTAYGSKVQESPNLYVNGTVLIYGSNSETQPEDLTDMYAYTDTVTGLAPFAVVPRWIAITGIATEIIISGIGVASRGAIS